MVALASLFDVSKSKTLHCIIPESLTKCGSDDDIAMMIFNSNGDTQKEMADSTTLIDPNSCKKN